MRLLGSVALDFVSLCFRRDLDEECKCWNWLVVGGSGIVVRVFGLEEEEEEATLRLFVRLLLHCDWDWD